MGEDSQSNEPKSIKAHHLKIKVDQSKKIKLEVNIPQHKQVQEEKSLIQALDSRSYSPMKRQLRITKQPCKEFYKDEGGKGNTMEAVVQIEYMKSRQKARPARLLESPLPLLVRLYFESKKPVESTDQDILTLKSSETEILQIDPKSLTANIKFRIEKVSRRKDGQKFRLYIAPDMAAATEPVEDISGIFTDPICVLSKRKSGSDGNAETSKRRKVSLTELTHVEERLRRRLDSLQTKMEQLVGLIQSQASRLLALETVMRSINKGNASGNYSPRSCGGGSDSSCGGHNYSNGGIRFVGNGGATIEGGSRQGYARVDGALAATVAVDSSGWGSNLAKCGLARASDCFSADVSGNGSGWGYFAKVETEHLNGTDESKVGCRADKGRVIATEAPQPSAALLNQSFDPAGLSDDDAENQLPSAPTLAPQESPVPFSMVPELHLPSPGFPTLNFFDETRVSPRGDALRCGAVSPRLRVTGNCSVAAGGSLSGLSRPGLKRCRSGDIQFNFGQPSSPLPGIVFEHV